MEPRPAFTRLFGAPRALIGMIHVGALPGTPRAHESIDGSVAVIICGTQSSSRIHPAAGHRPCLMYAISCTLSASGSVLHASAYHDCQHANTSAQRHIKRLKNAGLNLSLQKCARGHNNIIARLACEQFSFEHFVGIISIIDNFDPSLAGEIIKQFCVDIIRPIIYV